MGSITSTSRPAQRWQMPWQMPLLSHRRIHLTHCSRGVAFVWILVVGVAGSWRCVWSRRWAKGISIRLELLEVGLVSRYSPRPRRRSVELEEVVGVAVAAANDAPTRHCDRQSGCPQSKRRSSDWDARSSGSARVAVPVPTSLRPSAAARSSSDFRCMQPQFGNAESEP